jgi:flagellin-like hook-associated protein FlgL
MADDDELTKAGKNAPNMNDLQKHIEEAMKQMSGTGIDMSAVQKQMEAALRNAQSNMPKGLDCALWTQEDFDKLEKQMEDSKKQMQMQAEASEAIVRKNKEDLIRNMEAEISTFTDPEERARAEKILEETKRVL